MDKTLHVGVDFGMRDDATVAIVQAYTRDGVVTIDQFDTSRIGPDQLRRWIRDSRRTKTTIHMRDAWYQAWRQIRTAYPRRRNTDGFGPGLTTLWFAVAQALDINVLGVTGTRPPNDRAHVLLCALQEALRPNEKKE